MAEGELMRTGANNANWKGGRVRGGHQMRYWMVYNPKHPAASKLGYVLEHRLVAEKTLGRFLTSDEIVHHRDRDTLNNEPSNLAVMTQAEHARLHAYEHLVPNGYKRLCPTFDHVCEWCSAKFTTRGSKTRNRRFCSTPHYLAYRRSTKGQLKAGEAA